jgi:hypothetical protein
MLMVIKHNSWVAPTPTKGDAMQRLTLGLLVALWAMPVGAAYDQFTLMCTVTKLVDDGGLAKGNTYLSNYAVDLKLRTVDGNPASISNEYITWTHPIMGGMYVLDRTTLVIRTGTKNSDQPGGMDVKFSGPCLTEEKPWYERLFAL